jgi:hypothetical protein
MVDSMSDVLNIDDDTNEGITESADDKREDNGQNDDIEEYNQIC